MHYTYPLDSDVQALVVNSGLPVPAGFSYAGLAMRAQREWERRTGRIPFIGDTADVARTFDPPGPTSKLKTSFYKGGEKTLFFDAGLIACTSIALGVTPDNPDGIALDLQRQLRLMPANAPTRKQPYEWAEFYFPVYGAASSIKVVGRWGYFLPLSTTVTVGANSATQQLASTAGIVTGSSIHFAGANVDGVVQSVSDATHLVLTAPVTTTTGETVYLNNFPEDAWQAIQQLGGSIAAISLREAIAASPSVTRTKDEETRQSSFETLGDGWRREAERVIADYRFDLVI